MGEIPRQLAATLPPGALRLNARVAGVQEGAVELEGGERLEARQIVTATGLAEADGEFCANTTLYFAAPTPPVGEPILVLDGDGRGPVNSVVEMPYASPGETLLSCSVVGAADEDPALEQRARTQLSGWFGEQVESWRHLRTYAIRRALPAQPPGVLEPPARPHRLGPGRYACGDALLNGSIEGAIVSGRLAARAVLGDR